MLPRVPVLRLSKISQFFVSSVFVCVACFCFATQCLAQNYNAPYRIGLAYYHAGNFKQAFEQFNQLLARDPNDAILHYYAANCLVKLGRIKEAIADYRNCILLGSDSEAANLSRQALALWDKPFAQAKPIAIATPQTNHGAINNRQPPAIIDEQAHERARLIADSASQQLANLTKNYKHWVKVESDRLTYEIRSVPKRIEIGGKLVDNPDYDSIVANLRLEAERKASAMQADYLRRTRELTDDSTRRQELIISEGANVKSMYARDSGFSRMMPHGSNLYVRNYLNQSGMDDSPELVQSQRAPLPPALSAVAQPLRFGRQGPGRLLPPPR